MQKRKKKKSHIPFRLNLLFFIVFILFSALILRLGVVQIVYGENYKREIERTENVTVNIPVPRGKMFDRFHRIIVDNEPLNAITYTRMQGTSTTERLKLAEKLAEVITKDTSKVTERDMKDYWILTRREAAQEKLSEAEKSTMEDEELYQLQLKRITKNDLEEISEQELEIIAIKRELDQGYALTPQFVKKQVSDKEYAVVSEHLEQLPGINTTTDWDRKYVYGDTLKSFLGHISSAEQGIPRGRVDYYQVRGYSLNDRVGRSYLEYQYEDVLRGKKEKIVNITDKAGNLIDTRVVSKGERGNDIILTIDIELQQEVEKIIEEELLKAKKEYPDKNYLLDSAFVVMMNPKTGDIYSLAGKKYTKDSNGNVVFQDYSLGTTNNAYVMGSAVKGATILTGYETGVIEPNTFLLDTPIKIKNTPVKSSWKTMGRINDLTAIKQSSNVYMFRIAMMLGQYNYQYNQSAAFKNPGAFDTMRYYFSQFGLGVKTGIDLPIEGSGYTGQSRKVGHLMDLAIGQFDSYTPLQMAQYVSTIANGGYRMRPRLVKEIRKPTIEPGKIGNLVHRFEPEVLNKIDMDKKYVERVQEGFRQVMQEPNGTAYPWFKNAPYNPAGKTGTAETQYYIQESPYYGNDTTNLTLVGYAPFDQPEVAFAVVVPYAYDSHAINKLIGRRILDAYFENKKERFSDDTSKSEAKEENIKNPQ